MLARTVTNAVTANKTTDAIATYGSDNLCLSRTLKAMDELDQAYAVEKVFLITDYAAFEMFELLDVQIGRTFF